MANKKLNLQHIERIDTCDVEERLAETIGVKFGQRFSDYRDNWYKTLDYASTDYVPEFPLTVGVELLNKCNFSCSMCYTSIYEGPKIVIEEEVLDNLLKEFEDNEMPALMFGMGEEPLLYKDIKRVIERAQKAGVMEVFLFTNGLLLTEEMSAFLIDQGVSRVYVSLDAATPKTFEKIRGKNELSRVEANIHTFLKIRKEKGADLPIIRTSFCVQPDNIHEKEQFIEKWKNVVDHIDFQTRIDFSAVDRMSEIPHAERLRPTGNSDLKEPKCPQPFYMVTVWANGDVSPCCTFHGKNLAIGNVHQDTLKNIWNGEKANEIRRQFLENDPNIICQECISNRG